MTLFGGNLDFPNVKKLTNVTSDESARRKKAILCKTMLHKMHLKWLDIGVLHQGEIYFVDFRQKSFITSTFLERTKNMMKE